MKHVLIATLLIAVGCFDGSSGSYEHDGGVYEDDVLVLDDSDMIEPDSGPEFTGDGDGDGDSLPPPSHIRGDGDGDGDGDLDPGACVPSDEICDNVDNDCDGEIDEAAAANAYCEARLINTVTVCDTNHGVCISLECFEGFTQCDGEPGNGCEPEPCQ